MIYKLIIFLLLIFTNIAKSDIRSDVEDQCGSNLWEIEKSITNIGDYFSIITKYACTRGGEINDGIFYEYGEKVELVEDYNASFSYVGQIIDKNNKIIEDRIGPADQLTIFDIPSEFPYLVFSLSNKGASNIYHALFFYSTLPKFKKIAFIERPLNKFQANKRKGSEKEVDGIYLNKNGDFLIDRLIIKSVDGSESNANRKWNVETLKLDGEHFKSISIRDYDINTYQRLN